MDVRISKRLRVALLALLLAVCSVCLPGPQATGDAPNPPAVEKLMPIPGFAEGWTAREKVEVFNRENLYRHINGEAELYMPYGFDAAASVLYGTAGGKGSALAVDLYRMGSLVDAFGIYSNYRGPDTEPLKVGAEGFFTGTQLMFYQDRYFVQISSSGDKTPDKDAFMACARAIEGRLPAPGMKPGELRFLNTSRIVPRTERYMAESVLGYDFFRRGLTAEAVLGGKTAKVFVVFNRSSSEARKAFDQYADYLRAAKKEPKITEAGDSATLLATDPLYKGLALRLSGPYLVGAANLEKPEDGRELLDALMKEGK